jgi:hypothetical protein
MPSAAPHSAFAAFASRDFKLLTLNQCCLTFAVLIQEVLIAFHLYQITKNPLFSVYSGSWIFYLFWRCLYGVVILLIVLIGSVFYKSVLALPSLIDCFVDQF